MQVEDVVAIEQVVHLYAHAADDPTRALLAAVFTDDAIVDLRPLGHGVVDGLDAIAAWFARGKAPHPPAHHTTNVVVREVNGEIRVWSKWFVVNPGDGSGSTGDYEDIVVETAEGWRICRRGISSRYPPELDFSPQGHDVPES